MFKSILSKVARPKHVDLPTEGIADAEMSAEKLDAPVGAMSTLDKQLVNVLYGQDQPESMQQMQQVPEKPNHSSRGEDWEAVLRGEVPEVPNHLNTDWDDDHDSLLESLSQMALSDADRPDMGVEVHDVDGYFDVPRSVDKKPLTAQLAEMFGCDNPSVSPEKRVVNPMIYPTSIHQLHFKSPGTLVIGKLLMKRGILRFHTGHRLPMIVDFPSKHRTFRVSLSRRDFSSSAQASACVKRLWDYLLIHDPSLRPIYEDVCRREALDPVQFELERLHEFLGFVQSAVTTSTELPMCRRSEKWLKKEASFVRDGVTNLHGIHFTAPKHDAFITVRSMCIQNYTLMLNGQAVESIEPRFLTYLCHFWCPAVWTVRFEDGTSCSLFTISSFDRDRIRAWVTGPEEVFYLNGLPNHHLSGYSVEDIKHYPEVLRAELRASKTEMDDEEFEAFFEWLRQIENITLDLAVDEDGE